MPGNRRGQHALQCPHPFLYSPRSGPQLFGRFHPSAIPTYLLIPGATALSIPGYLLSPQGWCTVYLNSHDNHAPVVHGHLCSNSYSDSIWEGGYVREHRGEFFCKESFCNATNSPLMYLFCKFGFLYICFILSFSTEAFWVVVITLQSILPTHRAENQCTCPITWPGCNKGQQEWRRLTAVSTA